MKYYSGYKFVVAKRLDIKISLHGFTIKDTPDGVLTIEKWYPWDGNSGPFPDIQETIEASAVHDVLCDYTNMGWLPKDVQPIIDQIYYDVCVKNGCWEWVARSLMVAIRWYQTGKPKRYTRKMLSA